MMSPVLACRDLHVHYGRTEALRGVSFSVSPGSVYALLGRNGAGKSSLVRCLTGQRRADAGRADLFGGDAWTKRAAAMERVGYVAEEPDAPPLMTARQLEAFCARLYGTWDSPGVLERLRGFGIPLDTPSGQLSRGQKAQLALALALGHGPDLLILDDPLLGLDVVARKAFYQELTGDLADRGTTVFITTHDLAGIEGIADRVGLLRAGRLVADENLESLKARYRRILWDRESPPPLEALGATAAAAGPWDRAAVAERFDEAAFESLRATAPDLRAEPLSLEAIFIAAMGTEAEARP